MSKINKKKITAKKDKQKKTKVLTEEDYILKLQEHFIKGAESQRYDEDADIYMLSKKKLRQVVEREWQRMPDDGFHRNLNNRYKQLLNKLEGSELCLTTKARGQRSFYKSLKNRGYLDALEEQFGEKINIDKLQMTKAYTYNYTTKKGDVFEITYLNGGVYDSGQAYWKQVE